MASTSSGRRVRAPRVRSTVNACWLRVPRRATSKPLPIAPPLRLASASLATECGPFARAAACDALRPRTTRRPGESTSATSTRRTTKGPPPLQRQSKQTKMRGTQGDWQNPTKSSVSTTTPYLSRRRSRPRARPRLRPSGAGGSAATWPATERPTTRASDSPWAPYDSTGDPGAIPTKAPHARGTRGAQAASPIRERAARAPAPAPRRSHSAARGPAGGNEPPRRRTRPLARRGPYPRARSDRFPARPTSVCRETRPRTAPSPWSVHRGSRPRPKCPRVRPHRAPTSFAPATCRAVTPSRRKFGSQRALRRGDPSISRSRSRAPSPANYRPDDGSRRDWQA